MFTFISLGSGSAGNCGLLMTPECRLLIDGGLSARQIALRLSMVGVELEQLDGILLTHEHGDHAGGVENLCKKIQVPIYCNSLTAEAMRRSGIQTPRDWRFFSSGSDFSIKDIHVQTFPVTHDAAEPVGFVLNHDDASLGFLTDLGLVTKLVLERVRRVHTLVIETNHDEKLLQNDTRRPWSVKQRIMSRHGHLSNRAAAEVVGQLLEHGLRQVVLGHLSRDCNSPELAIGTIREHAEKQGCRDLKIDCATQREISPRFEMVKHPQMLPL